MIGIIGAMPSELADIRKSLTGAVIKNYSGFDFYINTYKDKLIINTGVAGGMDTKVKVCDIVVSDEVLPHDHELRLLNDYPPYNGIFKADEKLISIACEVCKEKNIDSHIGRVVSGEAFISSSEVKNAICEKFSPLAVDMETSAIGHCAFMNKMPFVSIRCISDNADDEGVMSFDEFEKIAAKRVAEVVLEMIEKI